eukprot:UN07167
MLTTDKQLILDEYINNLISEHSFLRDGVTSWPNFKTDYLPLIELARNSDCSIIPSNSPLRYVSLVNKNGFDKLP